MDKENTLLINKYQPLYFNDFEIDVEIIDILNTFIKMDCLNIMFTGNMGSGKTSLLNALIREYYKGYDNYTENILYINSLKEQGINYYRNDVKTFCQTCSTIKNKKKIIVLDDLDFINEQSQQVFRNCIDKFSHNVHFISSSSNLQKIIENLQSRFTIIKIKPLDRTSMLKILNKIKTNEAIHIDDESEDFLLDLCNNSAKILINYVEKFKLLNKDIYLDLMKKICTNINFCDFHKYTSLLKERKLVEALNVLYMIYDQGYSVMDILDNYFTFVKITSLIDEDLKYEIIPFICKYITVFHNIHEDEIELALFTNNLVNLF
jgi:DNA polymerase III delta prime subunit